MKNYTIKLYSGKMEDQIHEVSAKTRKEAIKIVEDKLDMMFSDTCFGTFLVPKDPDEHNCFFIEVT